MTARPPRSWIWRHPFRYLRWRRLHTIASLVSEIVEGERLVVEPRRLRPLPGVPNGFVVIAPYQFGLKVAQELETRRWVRA